MPVAPTTSISEPAATAHPIVVSRVDPLVPAAVAWSVTVEASMHPVGQPLPAAALEAARRLGIAEPGRVRVVVLGEFPPPENPALALMVRRHGFGDWAEPGRSHGSVILLKPRFANDPDVLGHELVHVAQQARMGQAAFWRLYLTELESPGGHARSTLEREANAGLERLR